MTRETINNEDRGVSLKSVKHILYEVCLHYGNKEIFGKLLERVDKLRDWEEYQALEQESKTEKVIKMRDATPEERESIDKYIKSISKPTGVDFGYLEQEPCEDAISRQQVRSEYADWYGYGYQDNWFYKRLGSMPSVAIPSAEPYKGMTNGEVIKAIFPHGKKEPKGWTMRFYIDEYCYDFSIDWWNSPYEPQERSE